MVTLSRTEFHADTLMMRSYAGECDLQAIATFLNLCEAVDQLGHYYSVSELRRELSEPGFDPAQDVRMWIDEAGQLIAYAQMWIPRHSEQSVTADGFLWFRVQSPRVAENWARSSSRRDQRPRPNARRVRRPAMPSKLPAIPR